MDSLDLLKEQLREALSHVNDPDYDPPDPLRAAVMRGMDPGPGNVQSGILAAIAQLRPASELPGGARAQRDYDVLYDRFVLGLTQEESAERLHMSVRTLRRVQREATHVLARQLWERAIAMPGSESEESSVPQQASDWRVQVRQELASLQSGAPGRVARVRDAVSAAAELERVLAARRGITFSIAEIGAELIATVHPAALRQILVMALAQSMECAQPGELTMAAERAGECITISLSVPASGTPASGDLIKEIVASEGGEFTSRVSSGRLCSRIEVPAAGEVTVLVIDDNADSVHFYRRCTAGTRYRILHATRGQSALEILQTSQPDVIVLDIMLPDVDGWDLMAQFQGDPAVRAIPVIVCSIIREQELASALGAFLYLPKPIRHTQFLEALDQAVSQAPTKSRRSAANNAGAC